MSGEKKTRKVQLTMLAFVALLLGAIGLILEILGIGIMGNIVQFLMFLIAAFVAYDITKDGKTFFKSFYKIAYWSSAIIVAVFIIIPFVAKIIELFK